MKFATLFLALLMCSAAFADPNHPHPGNPNRPYPQPQPQPAPYPAPAPVPAPAPQPEPYPEPDYGQVKSRVHRFSIMIERQANDAVALAKQLFNRGLYDRLTDDEVRAVAELSFVADNARQFREAVATENYYDATPVRSRETYMWLHRAYVLVERDPFINAQPELKYGRGPVARMERTMKALRDFYVLAERIGWSMAEVVGIADELERDTAKLYNLASRETDNRREQYILQQLQGMQWEAQNFSREARSITTPGSARVLLRDNFARLSQRFNQLDRLMQDPRFVRFSQMVRNAFEEVRRDYIDLSLSFNGGH